MERPISLPNLCKILIHLVKRRGYNLNAVTLEDKIVSGNTLKTIQENQILLKEKAYKTVGEMYYKDEKFRRGEILEVRNSTKKYKSTMDRNSILEEAKEILKKQQLYHFQITQEFIEKYCDIFNSQRSFDEGPASPSRYGGNMIEKMLGNCHFEKEEKRLPKATFSFEYYKLLQDINRIRLYQVEYEPEEGKVHLKRLYQFRTLTKEEKDILKNYFFNKKSKLKFSEIRKILHLSYEELFTCVKYNFHLIYDYYENFLNIIDEFEKETTLKEFEFFHKLKEKIKKYDKDYFYDIDETIMDKIGIILTLYKDKRKKQEALENLGLPQEVIFLLKELSFQKVSNLSYKAIHKIIPYLEKGFTSHQAIKTVYGVLEYDELEETDISNPVVKRGIAQTMKVFHAIVRKYGIPELIQIELAKELKHSFKKKKELEKLTDKNQKINEMAKKEIASILPKEHIRPQHIQKYKLWIEQNKVCMYSGREILLEDVFSDSVVIDYIVPFEDCFDNSFTNKVLVYRDEKQKRGEVLLSKFLKENHVNLDHLQNGGQLSEEKRRRIFQETIDMKEEKMWKNRNMIDTQYISKFVVNEIKATLKNMTPENENIKVNCINGIITHFMREKLGLHKTRSNDKHHALDAAIISAITIDDSLEKKDFYPDFKEDLEYFLQDSVENSIRINPLSNSIFVSRMPKRKVKGNAHKDTIYGYDGKKLISKVAITDLQLDKNNEIIGYYHKQDDRLLYQALQKQLVTFHGNAKKAFQEPFYKPKSNGEVGPLVKKVKIEENSTLNLYLKGSKGLVKNGDMVRIDLFFIPKQGYFFVPIYVADTIKDILPHKACIAHASYENWKEVEDQYFIFSIFPNDLLYIKSKQDMILNDKEGHSQIKVKEFFGYYIQSGISNSSIYLITHDRKYVQPSLGIRNLEKIEKYQVDILGNYHKVHFPEIRQDFSNRNKKGV